MVLSGWRLSRALTGSTAYAQSYGPGDFLYDLAGIDSTRVSPAPQCLGTMGAAGYPGLALDTAAWWPSGLLLSEAATIDTKPQLEIYADDVKCTHGATVGQLNEESIFYLRARGIGAETARRMLIHAFAGEIIDRVRYQPAREDLDRFVWDRLEANPRLGEGKA